VPDLGAEVPSIENGLLVPAEDGSGFTLTLTLKPGLLWSDGTPLTMNDFKYTYDWALESAKAGIGCSGCAVFAPLIDASLEGDALYANRNLFIRDIEVSEDGLTATVTWRQNFAGWLGWAATAFLPQHYFSTLPLEEGPNVMAVGSATLTQVPASGPFVITAASADGIDYARNDNWKATEPALLDQLRFRFYGSKDGMIAAFLAGEIDLALDMTQADYPAIAGVDPSIGRADLDSVWQYEHFDLNVSKPGLDDLAVRTAIAQAIDKENIISVLFPGTELEPACSVASPGQGWYVAQTCPTFDPAAAAAALDAAGWTVDETTGLRTKDGVGLRMQLCTSSGNPTRLTTIGLISQNLAAIGIPTDIATADAASVYFAGWADTTPDTNCSIYRGTYDGALFAWVQTGDIYANWYYVYHTSQIPSNRNPNGSNNSRISTPELDAALEALGNQVDLPAQYEAAAVVQAEMNNAIAEIPLYYRAETTGVGVRLGGYEKYNPSSVGPTWDVERWFVNP
jgi:peptide/nickel transport system substrate-binding protein